MLRSYYESKIQKEKLKTNLLDTEFQDLKQRYEQMTSKLQTERTKEESQPVDQQKQIKEMVKEYDAKINDIVNKYEGIIKQTKDSLKKKYSGEINMLSEQKIFLSSQNVKLA